MYSSSLSNDGWKAKIQKISLQIKSFDDGIVTEMFNCKTNLFEPNNWQNNFIHVQ
jgi:hypothetical protein